MEGRCQGRRGRRRRSGREMLGEDREEEEWKGDVIMLGEEREEE